jgi:type IV secretion system protein VirB1
MLPGLEQLILTCAPQVAPSTLTAIVRVESGGKPYALNVNGAQKLTRQPRDAEEAAAWADWLVARGYSVDMGLTQVNSGNLARLGLTPQQLFDPCTNLRAGGKILTENYLGAAKQYGSGQTALKAALSAYNTGNYKAGLANGYVAKVTAAADTRNAPPLQSARTVKQTVSYEPGEPHSPSVIWVKR